MQRRACRRLALLDQRGERLEERLLRVIYKRKVSITSWLSWIKWVGDSPTSWNKIDSEVVMIAPAARNLSRAIGISCLLQEETPSARTYTETPVSRRESVVWSTQTCD